MSGLFFTCLRFVVGIIFAVVQMPILYRYLPSADLGVYLLFFSINNFLILGDLGLAMSFGRAVSYIKGSEKPAGVDNHQPKVFHFESASIPDLLSSALAGYGVITVALIGFATIGGISYLSRIEMPLASRQIAQEAWLLFLGGAIIQMFAAVPSACLNGLGDVGWDQGIRAIVNLLWLIAIVVAAPITNDIRVLCVVYVGQSIVTCGGTWYVLKARHRLHLSTRGHFCWPLLRQMYSEGFPMFLTRIGSFMIYESGPLLVGYLLGAASVPDFVSIRQLIWVSMSIPIAAAGVTMPFAAMANASRDKRQVKALHSMTIRGTLALAGVFVVIIFVWGADIMRLWLGPGHFLGYGVLIPLGIMGFLETQHVSNAAFAWSAGKWPFVPWSFAGGVLCFGLGLAGGIFRGYSGVVLGMMIGQLLTNNWAGVYYSIRYVGIDMAQYGRSIFAPVGIFVVVVLGIALGVRTAILRFVSFDFVVRGLSAQRFVSLTVGSTCTLIVALFATILIVLRRSEVCELRRSLLCFISQRR